MRPEHVGGIEETDMNSFERVRAEDKRIINGHADVNQLVPFKYQWAWDEVMVNDLKYFDATNMLRTHR